MAKKRSGGKKQGNPRNSAPPQGRSSAPPSVAPTSVAPVSVAPAEAKAETKPIASEVAAPKSIAPPPAETRTKSMRPPAPIDSGLHGDEDGPKSSGLGAAIAAEAEKLAPKSEAKVETAAAEETKTDAKSEPKIETPSSTKMPASKAAKSLRGDEVADEFFGNEAEAVKRAHEEELRAHAALDDDDHHPSMRRATASELERRAKLRRIVVGVLGIAAAIALFGVGRSVFRQKSDPTPTAYAAMRPPAAPKTAEPMNAPDPVRAEAPKPEANAVIPATDEVKIADGGAAPTTSAKVDPAPAVAADGAAPGTDAIAAKPADPEAAKKLTKAALARLEAGDFKNAIEQAKASVDADPTDANAYLYWGTALMETGKTGAARDVFKTCVAVATHGPKLECRHFQLDDLGPGGRPPMGPGPLPWPTPTLCSG